MIVDYTNASIIIKYKKKIILLNYFVKYCSIYLIKMQLMSGESNKYSENM